MDILTFNFNDFKIVLLFKLYLTASGIIMLCLKLRGHLMKVVIANDRYAIMKASFLDI